MSVDLARRLLAAGSLQRDDAQRLLLAHVLQGVPLLKLLLDLGPASARALEDELARAEAKLVRRVVAHPDLVAQLPFGLCHRLWALPLRRDATSRGVVDVAALDPFDRNVASEMSFHLDAPVRVFRAPPSAMAEALRTLSTAGASSAPRRPPARPTPPYAEPGPGGALPAVPRWSSFSSAPPIPLVRPRLSSTPEGPRFPPPPPVPSVPWGPPDEGDGGHAAAVRGEARPSRPAAGPFPPRAPKGPFADIGSSLSGLRQARSRDEVLEHLLAGLHTAARRVGLFVVRQGEFRGWRCNEALGDERSFRRVVISSEVPSVFATAAAVGHYLGPVPRTPSHEALLGVMGGEAGEVAVTPVVVGGRPVLFALLDDVGDTMIATRRAEDLGRLAGEVLGRLLRRDKGGDGG